MTNEDILYIHDCIQKAFGRNGELAKAFIESVQSSFLQPLEHGLTTKSFRTLIARKNPYLYRASGIRTVEELVDRAFADFVSSSTETTFGTTLERFATSLPGNLKSAAQGVDIERRQGNIVELYALRSGPADFNSTIMRGLRKDLVTAKSVIEQRRGTIAYPFIGVAYGRKKTSKPNDGVVILSSPELWSKLSGDPKFYGKLLDAFACVAPFYQADLAAAKGRLLQEARIEFTTGTGTIDWVAILRNSSGELL